MLHQEDTDVLFPPRVIASLRRARGPEWKRLIDHLLEVQRQDESHPDVLAFMLMMVQQNSCLSCHAHSFRAMKGCTACTLQVLNRYRGTDRDLIQAWKDARDELDRRLAIARHPDAALGQAGD
ncbi:MAG: hypothetical protein GYB66_03245 [Chloroflexi bacterium]|nr:hypothetical protein [Chloroflexota bacterium]